MGLGNGWLVGGNAFTDGMSAILIHGTDVYHTGKVVQSKVVTTTATNIAEIQLVAESVVPDGTSIEYQVSNNNGRSWLSITPKSALPFESVGKKLRWRATLRTNNPDITPTLKKVTLQYKLGRIETFIENFHNTKNEDSKATTADWNTVQRLGQLSLATGRTTWTKEKGLPMNFVSGLGTDDESIMVGGYMVGLSNGVLAIIKDNHVSDLTGRLGNFNGAITGIGANGQTWLIGGQGQFYTWDGITMTNVSSQFANSFAYEFPHSITWNGSYWLISGSNGSIVRYDGTTVTDLRSLFSPNYNNVQVDSAWNGSQWLVSGHNGTTYLYDGSTTTRVVSPLDGKNIYSVVSNGSHWLLGGSNGLIAALYDFDGTTFTDFSSLVSGVSVGSVAWGGMNWLATVNYADKSAKTFTISPIGHLVRTEEYKNISFLSAPTGRINTGWVIGGSGDTSGFVLVGDDGYQWSGRLQSKQVNKSDAPVIDLWFSATDVTPDGTAFQYSVSKDGKHWQTVTEGKRVSFSKNTNRVYWRANLTTNSNSVSPKVTRVKLVYYTDRGK